MNMVISIHNRKLSRKEVITPLSSIKCMEADYCSKKLTLKTACSLASGRAQSALDVYGHKVTVGEYGVYMGRAALQL